MKMKMRMKVAGGAIREKENMKSGREKPGRGARI
jgi:hypothetical protein